MKLCTKCKIEKENTEFTFDIHAGRHCSHCRKCKNKARRERRYIDHEATLKKEREYRSSPQAKQTRQRWNQSEAGKKSRSKYRRFNQRHIEARRAY